MSELEAVGPPPTSQLRHGLEVLELVATRPRRSAEVARELKVNRSTAFRLLPRTQAAGYVTRRPTDGAFRVQPASILRLSAAANSIDPMELIHFALTDVQEAFGEATMFGVSTHRLMAYIAFVPSRHAIGVREHLGTTRPMHCSALGKAYLAAMENDALETELAHLDYVGGTELAPHTPAELRSHVMETRARGFAYENGETFEGGSCIAVALNIGTATIGAMGVSAPTARLPSDRVEVVAARLIDEAEMLRRPSG